MDAKLFQFCLTLCNPMDDSLPGSSVPGIFQARILEWVAITSIRGFFQPREWTFLSCIDRQVLYHQCHPGRLHICCCCCSVMSSFCNPMDCSTPGFPIQHHLTEFGQTHVYWVSDAIQTSHPLSSSSPLSLNLSQHQGLFQWVGSLHQVAKAVQLQLQHQSFQWILRTNFL